MAKLASDVDNPDFVGAVNPDSRLSVIFYKKAVQNEYETEQQKRPIFFDQDFVRIQVPGDTTTAIDTPARDEHKQRFPMHWARYQNQQGADAQNIGTPLEQWPRLTRSQVEELRALKFYTVEQIASASDAQLQRIGMLAGMSPYAFRDHAVRFLKVANDDATTSEAEERVKQLEEERAKEREEFKAQLAAMQEQIAALAVQKKRGRPKVKTE